MEYIKYIILEKDDEFVVERDDSNKTYIRYDDVEEDFEKELIHPEDLKNAVIECLNRYLEPVRDHFATNDEANLLYKTVKSYKIKKIM